MRVGTMLLKASLRCSVGCNVAVWGPPMHLRGVRFPPAFLLTETAYASRRLQAVSSCPLVKQLDN